MIRDPYDHNRECLGCDEHEMSGHAPDCPLVARYRYQEPGPGGVARVVELSGMEIVAEYFGYWAGEMRRAGKAELINYNHCVEDFCAVHWAERIP